MLMFVGGNWSVTESFEVLTKMRRPDALNVGVYEIFWIEWRKTDEKNMDLINCILYDYIARH